MEQHDLAFDIDAEAYLLGAVISARWEPDEAAAWRVLQRVCDLLEPQDFIGSRHQKTWQVIAAQVADGGPVDPLLIARRAARMKVLDACLDVLTMEQYAAASWYTPRVLQMARDVRGAALRRRIADLTADGDMEAAGACFAELRRLDEPDDEGIPSMAEVMDRYWETLDMDQGTPVPWGIPGLDRLTGGMLPGQLVVIGARTGVGKSSLALSVAHQAAKAGRAVGMVSIEMGDHELAQRLLAMRTGLSTEDVRSLSHLDEAQAAQVSEAMAQIAEWPLYIATTSTALADVTGRARAMHEHAGIELLIVDYVQLIRIGRRNSNRVEELEEITGALKQLARELHIPVMALAQLNRGSEDHAKPRLSDFRSSGSIEQDADIAVLLHHDVDGSTAQSDRLICQVAKQRNGPKGFVNLRRLLRTTQVVEEA